MIVRPRSRLIRRRGMVAVLVAVSLSVLLGAVALAADGGLMLAERRHAQATADAAALAAAADIFEHWPQHQDTDDEGHDPNGTAAAAANAVAAANGYTGASATVTVNISPTNYSSGPNAGTALPRGYIEVIVEWRQGRVFSNMFGTGDIPVKARSVARGGWIYAPPVWVGDRSISKALWIPNGLGGNITVGQTPTPSNPHGGRVIVNSSSLTASVNELSGAAMIAPEFFFTGGHAGAFTGTINSPAHPSPDPLRYLPPPAEGTARGAFNQYGGSWTLLPGTYDGGITYNTDSAADTLTFQPGVYYIKNGGFTINGPCTVNGSGVLFYLASTNASHSFYLQSTGNVTISPPTSGLYKGLTIFQNRDSPALMTIDHLGGSNVFNITGAVYAVNARVENRRQQTDLSVGSQFISRRLIFSGTGDMAIPGNFIRQRVVGGVE